MSSTGGGDAFSSGRGGDVGDDDLVLGVALGFMDAEPSPAEREEGVYQTAPEKPPTPRKPSPPASYLPRLDSLTPGGRR